MARQKEINSRNFGLLKDKPFRPTFQIESFNIDK